MGNSCNLGIQDMESYMATAFNFHPKVALILPLLFCLFLYKWLTRAPARTNLPPSPRGLPVIGNLYQLTAFPHRGLHALSLRHGDTMLIHLGANPVLIISSARTASLVMKTLDVAFASRPGSGVFRHLLYDGRDIASAPYGEYWRQIRSVSVLQLLSNSRVRSYSQVRKEEVSAMVAKIEASVGREVDLSKACMELTNDIVCKVAFGMKFGEKSEFGRLLAELIELLGGFFVMDFIPWLGWIDKVSGLDRRVETVIREFDAFFESVVREHEERGSNGDDGSPKDFVDVLLEVQKDKATGFRLERESIKGIILDAFVAGTDTTSTGLEWVMAELLRHPEAMKTLQEEVRGIIRSDRPSITEEDLHQMKYLKATLKESMRLHPPLPLLVARESTREVELNGYTVPKGTQVFINAWAIQRDPVVWEGPDEFRPERFLKSSVDLMGQDFELIPFGAGRRGCPGIQFAMASIELVLASLVGRFDWGLPVGAEAQSLNMEESNGITVHKKSPLIVVPRIPISYCNT